MLIIQIALGIVLAVIILAFLPQLFTVALWIVLAVLAVGAIAVAISTEVGRQIVIGIAVLVGIFWILAKFDAETKESKEATERMSNQDSVAPADAEEQRRRNLLSAAIVTGIVVLPYLVALFYMALLY